MLFNSPAFLFLFLPVAYGVFWRLSTRRGRYIWLTLTGYLFYAQWEPRYCLLMLFSTLVSYLAGLGMLRYGQAVRKPRWLLVLPITVDLLLLGFFKYAGFAAATLNGALTALHLHPVPVLHAALPIGISFYTFHTITYIVDAYRGEITPTRNFFEFSAYVSLFSQLVAGPIVRYRELQHDLDHVDARRTPGNLETGWSFFAIGMIEKVLIADTLAAVINPAWARAAHLSTGSTWLMVLGYAYQLYFDFRGYSHMAVGLGYLFGMHIPRNFNSPYQAVNPADFWRRWHISLSRCLRDYLYIPLSGNRGGTARTLRNVLVTMLLGGLWHGASWNFVLWGGYHGLLLIAYRLGGAGWDRLPVAVQRLGTFTCVVLGWVLFRSQDLPAAGTVYALLLWYHPGAHLIGGGVLLLFLGIAGTLAHACPNPFQLSHRWRPLPQWVVLGLFLLAVVRIVAGDVSPFLYFQF